MDASGAWVCQARRIPRDVAEALVIGYLFDTELGLASGVARPQEWPRVSVTSEPWGFSYAV